MKILHPDKKDYLPLDQLTEFYKDGIYEIIAADKKEDLKYFLTSFEDFRKENSERITNKELYKNLPYSIHSPLWKSRQKDITIIEKLINGRKNLKILDIGSWNGWLCNYFAKKGHNLVGMGVFLDEFDGLKAFKHFDSDYISLQLVLEEIFRIKDQFDIVIFNRNWSYVYDKKKIFLEAKNLLSSEGIIVFTGLIFYKNTLAIEQRISNNNKKFKDSYQIPLFLKPVKGYLNQEDYLFLLKNKIKIKSYHPFKKSIKSIFNKKPSIKYGIFIK